MSKLYNKYLELKAKNPNSSTLYLFKSGIFYIFLDKDAEIISSLLPLKLTKLNDSVFKCGFPVTHLEKYLQMLQLTDYKVKIVDDTSITSPSNYLLNEELLTFINEFLSKDIDFLSLNDAYQLLYDTKEMFLKISNNKQTIN